MRSEVTYLDEQVFDAECLPAICLSALDGIHRSRQRLDSFVIVPDRERCPLRKVDIIVHRLAPCAVLLIEGEPLDLSMLSATFHSLQVIIDTDILCKDTTNVGSCSWRTRKRQRLLARSSVGVQ